MATAEKRRVPLVRTEQEKISLANMIGDLSMNDSVVETSSKAERTKSKEERHKGTNVQKFIIVMMELIV